MSHHPTSTDSYPPAFSRSTDLGYDLPPAVKSLQSGWIATCTSSAIISALFATVESALLIYVKIGVKAPQRSNAAIQALVFFSYCALLLSLSATVSSLVLTDEFAEIPVRASRAKGLPSGEHEFYGSSRDLLSRFQARQSWRWVMWHWLVSLLLGYMCLVVQIILQVWLLESKGFGIVLTCVASFGILPVFDLFIPLRDASARRPHHVSGERAAYSGASAPGTSGVSGVTEEV